MLLLKKILILLIMGCVFLFACSKDATSLDKQELVAEIPNARLPNLSNDESGNILLSYVSQNDEQSILWISKWEKDNWSVPELVSSGDNWFVNWADFPSVIKTKDKYVAHWLEKNSQGTYAYGVRYSMREPSGEWGTEQWLHSDTSPTEHGFVSLQADKNITHAIWLDGRHMHSDGHASHDSHPKLESLENIKGMTLRYAFIDSNSEVTNREEVDSLTCDCCQTTSEMTAEGLVIAYRDRDVKSLQSEIRDIKVLRRVQTDGDYSWVPSENTPVDNWDIQACPVNGPMLSARKHKLALAWFTGAQGKSQVYVALSHDNGHSFEDKLLIDDANNLGRVGVDWVNDETIVVSWLGTKNGKSVLSYRQVNIAGRMGEQQIVTEMDMSRASGVPQIVRVNDEKFMLLWTKTGEQPAILSKVITIN